MTELLAYVERHPWWTLVYLFVLTGFVRTVLWAAFAAVFRRGTER